MAGRLVQSSISSPGFLGLNSEQSAATSRDGFATVLQNGVFDEAGKLVCREGHMELVGGEGGGADSIDEVFYWRKDDDESYLMAVGDDAGTATLYELTTTTSEYDTLTSRGTTTTVDVLLVNFNGQLGVFEAGQTPKVWDGTGTLANFAAATGVEANPSGGIALSAFGRLFLVSQDLTTVWGSELQPDAKTTGINWDNWFIDTRGNSGGAAKDGWTFGRDLITGLGAIGDLLVIFGSESVLVYSDINGTVILADSISGVGCVNQKTIVNTGDDIVFLSNSGLRSLRRTLEKDSPTSNDASAYVRTDMLGLISKTSAVAVFNQESQFYLLSDGSEAYYFDYRNEYPGGARRASSWTLAPKACTYDPENNRMFMAIGDGVHEYTGYVDGTSSYPFIYKSAWLSFSTGRIKIVKKLVALIYQGDNYRPEYSIAYDWIKERERKYTAAQIPEAGGVSEWGDTTAGKGWGQAEWGGYVDQVNRSYANVAGSGQAVRYGVKFNVNGQVVGLHEVRLFAKLGKLGHV